MRRARALRCSSTPYGPPMTNVRGDGELIRRTGGKSTGPIALMNMVNEAGRYVMQGGQRRSAIWAGLSWNHPDINKFIYLKDYSVDMKAVKAMFCYSHQHVYNLMAEGEFPKPIQRGRDVRWKLSDLEQFIEKWEVKQ